MTAGKSSIPFKSMALPAVMVCLSLVLGSCTQVRAWEKGYLAKREMAWEPDGLGATLNDHVFFSKEASSGGSSAAGGGCGCN